MNVSRPMLQDWFLAHQSAFTDRESLRHAAVETMSTTPKYASEVMRAMEQRGMLDPAGYDRPATGPALPLLTSDAALSLDAFRAQFDLRSNIRAGLARLTPGTIYPDQAFRIACGIGSTADWRRFADLPEFGPNRLRVRGVWHWAHPETIREMRVIIGG